MTKFNFNNQKYILDALESTNDGIWVWHVPSGHAYFTSRYYTMLGYEPDEFEANYQSWLNLLHPEDQDTVKSKITSNLNNLSDYEIEFRLKKKDGSWLWVLARGKIVERENDRPVVLVGTHIDIDSIKNSYANILKQNKILEKEVSQSTRELEQTVSLLETVFNAIPDVLGIQDSNHKMIRYNDAGYSLLGKNIDEITDKKCFELIGRTIPCEKCATSESYNTKKPASVVRYEEDLDVWFDVRSYPVLDEKGNVSKIIEHLRDISKEKKDELEKQQLKEQLFQAQKMESLGTLAGGIAHDFNNILMVIQGKISLIELKHNDPYIMKNLKDIENSITSAANLTKKLLGLARAGKYEVNPIEINNFLENSVELFKSTNKKIEINIYKHKNPLTIKADKTQLEQVLLNLLINSAQAMPGGGTINIKTDNYYHKNDCDKLQLSSGNYCHITVTDNGCGIPEENLSRIFDPFFTTKDKGNGTGLGLASAFGIIKNHQGSITATSTVGEGTTFHIHLPLTDDAPATEIITDKDLNFGNETILLVDDEDIVLDVHEEMLMELGYRVITATNGSEAIDMFNKFSSEIDLIVLDMVMPGLDIITTFESLSRAKPGVNILLCSGYGIEGQAQTIISKGCAGFIQKPFQISSISEKIREVLGS